MKIKYAGPKAIFTKHGIEFDNNKEDKYVYLNIAIQIYNALKHDYNPEEVYTYNTSTKRLSDSEILNFVEENFPAHEVIIKEAQEDAEAYFAHEKTLVKNRKGLISHVEYETWMNNIEMMKNYTIQQYFNKKIYYAIVQKIVDEIKTQKLKIIQAPMYQSFAHVFHSIQGTLTSQSKLEITGEDDELIVKLIIE